MTRSDFPAVPTVTALTCEKASPRRFTTRTQVVVLSCVCAGASAFLFAVDPSRHSVYPQCLLHNATGLYCAGCGATRALYALLHGRVLTALHDNVLFVALLPFALYWLATFVQRAWRADAWPTIHIYAPHLLRRSIAFFLLIAIFMIARNIPGETFDWLRPLP